jgi:hypothetical protein
MYQDVRDDMYHAEDDVKHQAQAEAENEAIMYHAKDGVDVKDVAEAENVVEDLKLQSSVSSATKSRVLERYLEALKLPEDTEHDVLVKSHKLVEIFDDFILLAEEYGRMILFEYSTSDSASSERVINTQEIGGIAGGDKFIVR